jgi:hypothetical protein
LQENDRAGCILAVGNSQADTLVAEPQDIVHAYMQFGMRAVLSEVRPNQALSSCCFKEGVG